MLTKNQFNVLVYLNDKNKKKSQRLISQKLDIALGTINKIFNELYKLGYIKDNKVTNLGLEVLEKYRVKRAIFIAAGFGSRLVPITLNTPKPLIKTKGKRIIETILEAVVEAEIEEIYIVRGYFSEQFDCLLSKFPQIKFIENSIYNESNNISSVYFARHLLKNTYICEADLFLENKELITKYQFFTNYLGIKVEETNDWCFEVKKNVITNMKIGGTDCTQMVGISYWNEEDGAKLEKDIEEVFLSYGGRERYWDEVPLKYKVNNYKINIRYCNKEDVTEIDSYAELRAFDPAYNIN